MWNPFRRNKPVVAPVQTAPTPFPESATAHRFLDGLNGIEIGANVQNSFGLAGRGGGYANVDFDATQSGKWQSDGFPACPVNIVANGNDLPFRDGSLDYVVTSHVLEHFFDPIGTLQEWLRVVRPGGYVFCIVPHRDRTYDRMRPVTGVDEMIDRNTGRLKPSDYIVRTVPETSDTILPADYMRIWRRREVPAGYVRLGDNSHLHQTVFDFDNMIAMCDKCGFNVVYSAETDDKVGTGFTVVLEK